MRKEGKPMEMEIDSSDETKIIQVEEHSNLIGNVTIEEVRKASGTKTRRRKRSKSKDSEKIKNIENEGTIDLQKFNLPLRQPDEVNGNDIIMPSVAKSNIVGLLKQAVNANDEAKILLCVQSGTDDAVLDITLAEIGKEVQVRDKFIISLVTIYLSKPRKHQLVLKWLKRCFVLYASTLMENPDVKEVLGKFQAAAGVRLKNRSKLEHLQEKLKLTIAMVENSKYNTLLTSKTPAKDYNTSNQAKLIYNASTDGEVVEK